MAATEWNIRKYRHLHVSFSSKFIHFTLQCTRIVLNNHFQSFWYSIERSRKLKLAAITPKWENANTIVIFAPIKANVVSIYMFLRAENLAITFEIVSDDPFTICNSILLITVFLKSNESIYGDNFSLVFYNQYQRGG